MRTNAVPTHFQAAQFDSSIQRRDIDLLRDAAASLESRLTIIRRDCKTALSPTRHLRGEILAKILHRTQKDLCDPRSRGRHYIFGFDFVRYTASWREVIETLYPELYRVVAIDSIRASESAHSSRAVNIALTFPSGIWGMTRRRTRALTRNWRKL
ncbi:uncharacterized protein BT62DRAFT_1004489 [Guyanagaster necrorhizus]|uniref:Uncharacterized protein n=1 Tax=Guyanagaster necrorhizus TaxID=856835 RepID=A0A9P8AVA7_9AGAR|nr:uncharacterized protein BT62DRAFT_1004489 [Guyanagaster necrorhizus MCA 3950]KAG7447727.1 hypothetical protein BT62DRAFT_1004489 [Guyanagaster necrorhizus MCA 3950]